MSTQHHLSGLIGQPDVGLAALQERARRLQPLAALQPTSQADLGTV